MLRRLARRMQVTRSESLTEYFDALRENPDEAQALLADLLISVTTFFRDGESFEALQKLVLPQLFQKEAREAIRVWVPGCATGEEAYSIAMLLLEENGRQEDRRPIQVFGSDVDARALAIAREGRFPSTIEVDVSEERLRRFFVREGDGYRVRQELRDLVLFAQHSLLKDPPFSRIDLVSCRNVLIYLDRDLQEQVNATFHYALNPGGFLFLGASETADNPPGLFRSLDRTTRLYQSTAQDGTRPRYLPRLLTTSGPRDPVAQLARPIGAGSARTEAALHRRAIERIAPPSILVDRGHRVLHLSENAGRFVQPTGGPLTGDIVDLVRPEFRFELRTALHRVFERQEATLSLPIPVRFNGHAVRVHMHVKPGSEDASEAPTAVVMFIEGEAVEPQAAGETGHVPDEVVQRLRDELELVHGRLRTTQEESEGANEELRAANEELQSINEEYRSTSEELETSKEELQSINEELQTVNSELKLKLDTVSRAHSDLQNLMAATDVGTLFVDANLRIKRFTERVTELFSITESDEGRPITNFAHQLEYEGLVQDAQAVLGQLAPIRREIRSRDGRWFDIRLRPYRTIDDRIDGVVMTFLDITERLRTEEALRSSERELRQTKHLVEVSHDPIFIWDFEDGIREWNRGSAELYGFTREEALGKDSVRLLSTQVPGASIAAMRAALEEHGNWSGEVLQKSRDGRELNVEVRLELETFGDRRLVLESAHDVTERKALEQRQTLLLGELTHRVRNTLAVVQAIAHQTARTSTDMTTFGERFDGRLQALSRAHAMLVASDWRGADLASLARNQLEPYVSDGGTERIKLEGEPVSLPADLATPFGLVLHELATNAAKYGALSLKGGTVRVEWTLSGDKNRRLRMVWTENGGPPTAQPKSTGLGSTLIENGIPLARVSREFLPAGLVCTVELELPDDGDATDDGSSQTR